MSRRRRSDGFDPNQLQLTWSGDSQLSADQSVRSSSTPLVPSKATFVVGQNDPAGDQSTHLIQRLPWDFKESFPSPTQDAIDAGVINADDSTPAGIRAIHDEHARELMMVLHDLDAVLDARRRGVDPVTGKPPRTFVGRNRLEGLFATEPTRLERAFSALMAEYESAFGVDAAEAFEKAIRAWHAGIPVVTEAPAQVSSSPATSEANKSQSIVAKELFTDRAKRIRCKTSNPRAVLPVPKPLATSVASGAFGSEESGKPINPSSDEVREITETLANNLVNVLYELNSNSLEATVDRDALKREFRNGVEKYAEDFGLRAAHQLEAYVRREYASGLLPIGQHSYRR